MTVNAFGVPSSACSDKISFKSLDQIASRLPIRHSIRLPGNPPVSSSSSYLCRPMDAEAEAVQPYRSDIGAQIQRFERESKQKASSKCNSTCGHTTYTEWYGGLSTVTAIMCYAMLATNVRSLAPVYEVYIALSSRQGSSHQSTAGCNVVDGV